MKRPKIKKDAITELLRSNLAAPELSPGIKQPDPDHTWHSCYDIDTGTGNSPEKEPTTSESITVPSIQPLEVIQWLKSVGPSDLVFCSGRHLQHLRSEILGPGPNFCVAGTLCFFIDGVRMTASQLSVNLLERPNDLAVSNYSGTDPSIVYKRKQEHSDVLGSGGQSISGMLQSPRIGALNCTHHGTTPPTDCIIEDRSDNMDCYSESKSILVCATSKATLGHTGSGDDIHSAEYSETEKYLGNSSRPVAANMLADPDTVLNQCTGKATLSSEPGPLAAAIGRILDKAVVMFQVSRNHLPQRLEWLDEMYVPVRWSNILHPAFHITLRVASAVRAVTTAPMAPETCINT